MNAKLRTAGWLLAALLVAGPLAAQQDCADYTARPQTAGEASIKFDQLLTAGCLGEEKCPTALCEQFEVWAAAPTPQGALGLLTDIRNSAAAAGESENLTKLVNRIDAWIAALGSDPLATLDSGKWRYETGREGLFLDTPFAIEVVDSIEAGCSAGGDPCAGAFAEAVEIVTDANLVVRTNGVLQTPERAALQEYITALDQRWENYFNRAPTQFPWELAINSILYQRNVKRGFNEPPSSQWIVLHPTVAYEYVNDDEEKFKSALALEALGYFTRGFGGSLAAVWSDRAEGERFGYGFVLHWQNKITIGVMRHSGSDGGTGILVSPNIEKFVNTNAKKVRDILTRVR